MSLEKSLKINDLEIKQMSYKNISEQVESCLVLQAKLEDTMHPNWKTSPVSENVIAAAIITELGEVYEELQYKWWKQYDVYIDNAKLALELVDVFHFVLLAKLHSTKRLNPVVIDTLKPLQQSSLEQKAHIINAFIRAGLVKREWNFSLFFEMCYECSINYTTILKMYKLKYAINILRSITPQYSKIWIQTGQRDDISVYRLLIGTTTDNWSIEQTIAKVQELYEKHG